MGLSVPSSGQVYLDANSIIYSVEKIEPYASILEPVWTAAGRGQISIVSSELVALEVPSAAAGRPPECQPPGLGLQDHRDFSYAAPTPDHFIPLLYFAGLTAAGTRPAKVLVDGYAFGSLSMTAYTLDADCPRDRSDRRPSASMPDLDGTPPEDTNL